MKPRVQILGNHLLEQKRVLMSGVVDGWEKIIFQTLLKGISIV
jgi:hypothetical protein